MSSGFPVGSGALEQPTYSFFTTLSRSFLPFPSATTPGAGLRGPPRERPQAPVSSLPLRAATGGRVGGTGYSQGALRCGRESSALRAVTRALSSAGLIKVITN